jgi:hypothetical protein
MKRAVILALLAGALPSLSTAQSRPPLQGAWQVVEVTTTGPDGATNTSPQPGLYLFTARQQSDGVGQLANPSTLRLRRLD